MRFKIDENLPVEVAELLRANGHAADTVFDENLTGAHDQRVAEACAKEGRFLITIDLDFADIRAFPSIGLPGTIVLRLHNQGKSSVLAAIGKILPLLQEGEGPTGQLWIVEESQLRVRALP